MQVSKHSERDFFLSLLFVFFFGVCFCAQDISDIKMMHLKLSKYNQSLYLMHHGLLQAEGSNTSQPDGC